jgi:hypothetical protein
MKKIDLLHTTVLIIAIICGYSALAEFLSILGASVYFSEIFTSGYGSGGGGVVVPILGHAVVYAIVCIVMVRNSKRIATWLLGNDRPEYEEFLEESGSGKTSAEEAKDVEAVTARSSAAVTTVAGIDAGGAENPDEIITQFRTKVAEGSLNFGKLSEGRDHLLLDLLRVTISTLVIYAAPTLTNLIDRTLASRLGTESQAP